MSIAIKRAGPLAKIAAIVVRDARVAISYPGSFVIAWASIFVEVVIAWYISRLVPHSSRFSVNGAAVSYFQYIAVNSAFLRFQTAALNSFADSIRDSQLTGTLEMVIATPTRLPTLILSSGLWAFGLTTLQTIVYLAVALHFGLDLSHLNGLTAFVFLALTVVAISPLGVLAAALAMIIKKTGPVEFVSNASAQIFGGVYLPLASLAMPLQIIGWSLPITHALNGFRAAASGVSLLDAWPDAVWLFVSSCILLPLSLWLFNAAVRKARVDGTLAMY